MNWYSFPFIEGKRSFFGMCEGDLDVMGKFNESCTVITRGFGYWFYFLSHEWYIGRIIRLFFLE